mgnify:FL=1
MLVTRYQQHVRQHQRTLEQLRAESEAPDAGFRLLATCIPQAAALADALVPRDLPPTFTAKYNAHVPTVLIPLVEELKGILHGA